MPVHDDLPLTLCWTNVPQDTDIKKVTETETLWIPADIERTGSL